MPTLGLASPQLNPVPADVSIPIFAAPTGMTVIPITFTAAFGTVPAGYVTYLTQPVEPSGPVYSTGTAPVTTTKVSSKHASSKATMAVPVPTTVHRSSIDSSSSSSIETTRSTQELATSRTSASQQTQTGAANAMVAAAALPGALAAIAGIALL